MDDIVKQALKKWPNVPHCFGWLALDARGDWYMRDERIQAAGPFPQVKGSRIRHDKLLEFIHRNYEADDLGAWFFQNGPQRVYVELEAAPWVLRVRLLDEGVEAQTHTGLPVASVRPWLDEQGRLFAETERGFAVVHPQDVLDAAGAIERGAWDEPAELPFAEMPGRFGYVPKPQPAARKD
jgi:hypothetical protein